MFVITYVFTLHFHIHISFMHTNFSNLLLFKFAYFYQTEKDGIFWHSLELNLTCFFAHLSHIWTLKNYICIYLHISIVTVHFRSRTWNTLLSKKETHEAWNMRPFSVTNFPLHFVQLSALSTLMFRLSFKGLRYWCLILLRSSDLKTFPLLYPSSRCYEAISTEYVA